MPNARLPRFLPVAALAAALFSSPAAAQQPVEGPRLKVGAAEIQIGGRVHTQLATTSVDGVPSSLFLRRVRLDAVVKVNDVVSGEVQPDFAGDRVSVKDAYLKLAFDPAVQLLAGKAHRPFGLLEQVSSNRILPIERGLRIPGVAGLDEYALVNSLEYSDRDVGIQLMGEPAWAPLGLAYAAGVFRGPLHRQVPDESYQYAARLTVSPLERLVVGAGWSSRHFGTVVNEVVADVERGHAFEVDVQYGAFAPGVHFLGEVAFGDADPFTDTGFLGAQGWLGYRTERLSSTIAALEPVLRVSYGDLDVGEGLQEVALGGMLVTPGVNLWLGGLNRVALNYDVWLPAEEGADTVHGFKAMFQLGF